MKKIIITGSNKGIGFGLLKDLSSKPFEIIMACRNLKLAKTAISTKLELEQQKKIIPMELDLNYPESIQSFTKEIQKKFKSIDILVNNAGIKREQTDEKTIKEVLQTNFFGTVELTEQLLPTIRDFGKILIIGSTMGKYKLALKSDSLKQQFDSTRTNEEMYQLVGKYLESVRNNSVENDGWAKSSYCVSKMCVDVYAQNLGRRTVERNIQVYACCPGNTKTDLGGPKARFTVDQAIITPLHLINLPEVVKSELQGKLFYNKKVFSLWDPR